MGLVGARVKFQRAQRQFHALYDEIKTFQLTHPYRVATERNPERTKHIRRLVHIDRPDAVLSARVGEFLYLLRSSLDNYGYWLGAATTSAVPDDTEFPIFTDGSKFNRRNESGEPAKGSGLYKIRTVEPEKKAIIEFLQPYRGGDTADPRVLGIRQGLRFIHDFNRIDKHRAIHLIGGSLILTVDITTVDLGGPTIEHAQGPLQDGTALTTYTFATPQDDVDMQDTLSVQVCIEETPVLPPAHVLNALWNALVTVQEVMSALGEIAILGPPPDLFPEWPSVPA